MRVLVTGADGFVGRTWCAGCSRRATRCGPASGRAARWKSPALSAAERAAVERVPLELLDTASVASALDGRLDAVIHLAAIASGVDARRDVGAAWAVNAAGTARLSEALGRRQGER